MATTFLLTPPVELELAKHIVWPPLGDTAPWSRSLRDVKARIAKKDGFAQLAELRAPVLLYLVQTNWVRHHGPREYMDQLVLATCLTGIEAKPLHGLCTGDGGLSREAELSGVSLH